MQAAPSVPGVRCLKDTGLPHLLNIPEPNISAVEDDDCSGDLPEGLRARHDVATVRASDAGAPGSLLSQPHIPWLIAEDERRAVCVNEAARSSRTGTAVERTVLEAQRDSVQRGGNDADARRWHGVVEECAALKGGDGTLDKDAHRRRAHAEVHKFAVCTSSTGMSWSATELERLCRSNVAEEVECF